MEALEKRALVMTPFKPNLYRGYVDDNLVICPHVVDKRMEFVAMLNSSYSSTKFIVELKVDGIVPFSDMLIRKADGTLDHTVYSKPTHTNLYVNDLSPKTHHPVFSGV